MKTTKKSANTAFKPSEKAVKSIQHIQHLREEINTLIDGFLGAAKKGNFDSTIFSGLKSSANELKDSIKKVKKHIPQPEKTKSATKKS